MLTKLFKPERGEGLNTIAEGFRNNSNTLISYKVSTYFTTTDPNQSNDITTNRRGFRSNPVDYPIHQPTIPSPQDQLPPH